MASTKFLDTMTDRSPREGVLKIDNNALQAYLHRKRLEYAERAKISDHDTSETRKFYIELQFPPAINTIFVTHESSSPDLKGSLLHVARVKDGFVRIVNDFEYVIIESDGHTSRNPSRRDSLPSLSSAFIEKLHATQLTLPAPLDFVAYSLLATQFRELIKGNFDGNSFSGPMGEGTVNLKRNNQAIVTGSEDLPLCVHVSDYVVLVYVDANLVERGILKMAVTKDEIKHTWILMYRPNAGVGELAAVLDEDNQYEVRSFLAEQVASLIICSCMLCVSCGPASFT